MSGRGDDPAGAVGPAAPPATADRDAGVTGIATYVPEGRMSPEQLAETTGIPPWVVRDKLGLHGRVLPTHDDQPTAMAVRAARVALERAGRSAADVDVVICITEEHK